MVIVRLESASRLSFRNSDSVLDTFFGMVADALIKKE
jgi:hypothetical protein